MSAVQVLVEDLIWPVDVADSSNTSVVKGIHFAQISVLQLFNTRGHT